MKHLLLSLFWAFRHPYTVLKPQLHLFIMGHPRSRSTLLAHLLGSHNQIVGHIEAFRSYQSRLDLWKLRIQLHRMGNVTTNTLYLLDKLNLNQYQIASHILQLTPTHFIFLVRRPQPTIQSIVRLGRTHEAVHYYGNVERAVTEYCTRLARLVQDGQRFGSHSCFIESDQLIECSDDVLGMLTAWLELDTPLQKSYSVFPETGKIWHGDPSPAIRSGNILPTVDHNDQIEIPASLLVQAEQAYSMCCTQLGQTCAVKLQI